MTDSGDDFARIRSYVEQAAEAGPVQLPPEPKLAEILNVSQRS